MIHMHFPMLSYFKCYLFLSHEVVPLKKHCLSWNHQGMLGYSLCYNCNKWKWNKKISSFHYYLLHNEVLVNQLFNHLLSSKYFPLAVVEKNKFLKINDKNLANFASIQFKTHLFGPDHWLFFHFYISRDQCHCNQQYMTNIIYSHLLRGPSVSFLLLIFCNYSTAQHVKIDLFSLLHLNGTEGKHKSAVFIFHK